jgi:anthranilate synthase component 2
VPKVVLIDNYDSFTYNLVQYLGELGAEVEVRRHDAIDVAGVAALALVEAAFGGSLRHGGPKHPG